jgi:hypothetical protein
MAGALAILTRLLGDVLTEFAPALTRLGCGVETFSVTVLRSGDLCRRFVARGLTIRRRQLDAPSYGVVIGRILG